MLGALLSGWDIGTMGGNLAALSAAFGLKPAQQGLVVGIALFGAMIGALACGRASTKYGGRRAIMAGALLYAVSAAISALAPSLTVLLMARLVVGIGFGVTATLVPVFLADIAAPGSRGPIVALAALAIAVAIVLAYLVAGLSAMAGVGWRYVIGFAAVPAIASAAVLSLLPDGPHWLARQSRNDEAARSVSFYLGDTARIASTEASMPTTEGYGHRSRRGLIVRAVVLAMCQQIAGINAVLYFVPRILLSGEAAQDAALWVAVGVGTINLVATVVALWALDRTGRRPLLLISTTVVVALHLALATALSIGTSPILVGSLLCLFVAAFAMGLGSVTWTLLSELLPIDIRDYAMGIAVGALWGTNLGVALVFPILLASAGPAATFGCFAAVSLAALMFIAWFIPETKLRGTSNTDERYPQVESSGAS